MLEALALLSKLDHWAYSGSRDTVGKASGRLAVSYRNQIKSGKNADRSSMKALKPITLASNVRNDGHQTKRSVYGSTPMHASGMTADSIESKIISPNEWEISSSSRLGDQILSSNAKTSHSGIPFGGDTPKDVRDPLQVSNVQMDFIADQIEQDLAKVIA